MIVPTLDEAATIEHTLAAALPQLGPADELLVVDGGSADDTLARVRSLDAPRLRVLTHDRPSRALQQNLGAAAAKGPWLLFLHADTRLPLGALERVRASATDWGYFALALDAVVRGHAAEFLYRAAGLSTAGQGSRRNVEQAEVSSR